MRRIKDPGIAGRPHEHGQVIVLFALMTTVVLALSALVIDSGMWMVAQRNYQNVADSAASAGAAYLQGNGGCGSLNVNTCGRAAAARYVQNQLGVTGLVAAATANNLDRYSITPAGGTVPYLISIASPPGAATGSTYPGIYATDPSKIYIAIQANDRSYLAGAIGITSRTITGWATANKPGGGIGRLTLATLRPSTATADPPSGAPNTVRSILLSGGSVIKISSGDVASNWNYGISGGSTQLQVASGNVWYGASCVTSCGYAANQINVGPSGSPPNTTISLKALPALVTDPNYAPPAGIPVVAHFNPTAAVPLGDYGGIVNSSTVTFSPTQWNGTLTEASCPAGSPAIGPGVYSTIVLPSKGCLILDPLNHHNGAVTTPLSQTEKPGIFYVTDQLRIDNALVWGEGVTLILRPAKNCASPVMTWPPCQAFDFSAGGGPTAMILNQTESKGAWTTSGASPYAWVSGSWEYATGVSGFGMAIYVVTPERACPSCTGKASSYVFDFSGSATASWNGMMYAPRDNVSLSGSSGQSAVGSIMAWTVSISGGGSIGGSFFRGGAADSTCFCLVEPTVP